MTLPAALRLVQIRLRRHRNTPHSHASVDSLRPRAHWEIHTPLAFRAKCGHLSPDENSAPPDCASPNSPAATVGQPHTHALSGLPARASVTRNSVLGANSRGIMASLETHPPVRTSHARSARGDHARHLFPGQAHRECVIAPRSARYREVLQAQEAQAAAPARPCRCHQIRCLRRSNLHGSRSSAGSCHWNSKLIEPSLLRTR